MSPDTAFPTQTEVGTTAAAPPGADTLKVRYGLSGRGTREAKVDQPPSERRSAPPTALAPLFSLSGKQVLRQAHAFALVGPDDVHDPPAAAVVEHVDHVHAALQQPPALRPVIGFVRGE